MPLGRDARGRYKAVGAAGGAAREALLNSTPKTTASVNSAFKTIGVAERLQRGKDYFYFTGGNSHMWPQSGVYGVSHVGSMTVRGWKAERDRLAADYKPRPAGPLVLKLR